MQPFDYIASYRLQMWAVALLAGALLVVVVGCAAGNSRSSTAATVATVPTPLEVEVYSCFVVGYEHWVKRSSPRGHDPYRYSAHVEMFLPKLGVVYMPSTKSFMDAAAERYANSVRKVEGTAWLGPGWTTIQSTRLWDLTLTDEAQREIQVLYEAYLEEHDQASRLTDDGG